MGGVRPRRRVGAVAVDTECVDAGPYTAADADAEAWSIRGDAAAGGGDMGAAAVGEDGADGAADAAAVVGGTWAGADWDSSSLVEEEVRRPLEADRCRIWAAPWVGTIAGRDWLKRRRGGGGGKEEGRKRRKEGKED